jgi:hypothetical protein
MREAPLKTTAFQQGIFATNTTAKEKVGTLRVLDDGRKFRYAKAGAAITAGQAVSCSVVAANHIGATVAAVNNSNVQVTLTITAGTAVAANHYAGGYLQINTGVGAGRSYRIASNTEVSAAATAVTFNLEDRFAAYDGTTRVAVVPNPCAGVLVGAVGATPAGVAVVAIDSGSYGWIQTAGMVAALITGTPAVGSPVILGAAGALAVIVAATSAAVGNMTATVGVTGQYKPVMLNLE